MRVYALPPCLDSAARLGQPPTLKETTPSRLSRDETPLLSFVSQKQEGISNRISQRGIAVATSSRFHYI